MSRSTRRSDTRAATRGHQSVVINSVEKFRQVNIDNEPIAIGDVGLRLCHRLVGGAPRPEAVAVLAERRVPQRLEPLQHRLLDHAIDHGWNAEVADPAVRLRDFDPTHRLRLVGSLEQLIPNLRPVLTSGRPWQSLDGHPVDAGAPCCANSFPRSSRFPRSQISSISCSAQAGLSGSDFATGGSIPWRPRPGASPRPSGSQGQRELDFLPRSAHESPVLLALSSFGPSVIVSARPICCSAFRPWSASLALPTAGLLCPLLTSAPRSGGLAAPSVADGDTAQISRGKLNRLPRTTAGFTAPRP